MQLQGHIFTLHGMAGFLWRHNMNQVKSALLLYLVIVSLLSFICYPLSKLRKKEFSHMDKPLYCLAMFGGATAILLASLFLYGSSERNSFRESLCPLFFSQLFFFSLVFFLL